MLLNQCSPFTCLDYGNLLEQNENKMIISPFIKINVKKINKITVKQMQNNKSRNMCIDYPS